MKNFVVYSKDGCPYCDKIQQVDFAKEEFYNEFGQGSTFPRVICNDEILGGCNETIQWLREQKVIQ